MINGVGPMGMVKNRLS